MNQIQISKETKFFDTDITVLHICLGAACDMKCEYCYHHTDTIAYKKPVINEDIFPFIEEMAQRQKNKELIIRFFGGEPLVYYDEIKYVVERLAHLPNLQFNTITNGKQLTQDKIDFFNKHNFWLLVSWDGHSESLKYRHFDVFSENKNVILQINKLVIMATFVDFTKIDVFLGDLKTLNKEYYALHDNYIHWSWAPVDDTGSQTEFINNSNNKIMLYQQKAKELCDKTKEAILKPDRDIWDMCLISAFIDDIGGISVSDFKDRNKRNRVQWGSDNPKTMSLGLDGNLYRFHRYLGGTSRAEKIGDIYMSYFEYLYNFFFDKEYIDQRAACNCDDCATNLLCFGPGPHIAKESVAKMCNIRHALYTPIVELIEWFCNGGLDLIKNGK